MSSAVWSWTAFLVALALVSQVSVLEFDSTSREGIYDTDEHFRQLPYVATVADEQYIRHIHSMYDAYRADKGSRLVVETNALIDTKYRTWKRNADLINSLLALPKGMNDAGR